MEDRGGVSILSWLGFGLSGGFEPAPSREAGASRAIIIPGWDPPFLWLHLSPQYQGVVPFAGVDLIPWAHDPRGRTFVHRRLVRAVHNSHTATSWGLGAAARFPVLLPPIHNRYGP